MWLYYNCYAKYLHGLPVPVKRMQGCDCQRINIGSPGKPSSHSMTRVRVSVGTKGVTGWDLELYAVKLFSGSVLLLPGPMCLVAL